VLRIEFPCTAEVADLVHEIAATMVFEFNIPLAETEGRINKFWNGFVLVEPLQTMPVLHETADYWAKTIYYGPGVPWWRDGENLTPTPYP
jgi:hypothetical protein